MADTGDGSRTLEILTKRTGILRRLADTPAHKRDLVDELDQSRSTINRAIGELEEVDLVRRGDEGFEATTAGELALDRLETFRGGLADLVDAEGVLSNLPFDAPIETATVVGGQAIPAAEPAPYRPLEPLHDDLEAASRYRAVLPALDDPRHVRLLYERVVTAERPAEVVVSPELFDTLRREFPRRTAAMAETENFELSVGEVPPFSVSVVDAGPDDDPDPTVFVVVFSQSGGVEGCLVNDTPAAIRWAQDRFETARKAARERTEELATGEDRPTTSRRSGPQPRGGRISVALEREGFVGLEVSYFREEPVADPTTAWRTGPTIPEVHTGYAVERTAATGDSTSKTVADALLSELRDGHDSVLIGPPGSGKSTVCKRVACEWYATDRGPVLYRESGRGRPFESVEDLVLSVEAVDGHALVVVEDAVRSTGDAVFDAIERLGDREDVSFLLDARESEYDDPPGDPTDVEGLSVRTMPSLDEADAERIVDHFERTTGETVGTSSEHLLSETGTGAYAEDTPGEVLLLLHRLSNYADPLAGDRSSLQSSVASAYDEVAGDDLAMDVCVLANVLNATDAEFDTSALYAVGDASEFEDVDDAIATLEGTVLFPSEDGTYRTVHEYWSVAFLEHLLETEGEAIAAERFGDCVTAYLGLADDPARRDRIARHLDGQFSLDGIATDPGTWADDATEAVYSLARRRPKLVALFGHERASVALPEACSDDVVTEASVRIGWAAMDAGDLERSDHAFRRLPEDDEGGFERLLGRSRVAEKKGDYEAGIERAKASLELAETLEDPRKRARAERRLGRCHSNAEEYESGRSHLQRALDRFEALDDRRGVESTLDYLGAVAFGLGDLDAAADYHERSLELGRQIGSRHARARSLHYLGSVEKNRGDFDAAREYYERSLELNRHLGNPNGIGANLDNLGIVARRQGEYGDAEQYHQRSVEVSREIGDPQSEARNLGNLGLLSKKRGDYEAAREYYEESIDRHRELGLDHGEAKLQVNLAEVAVELGEYDDAREHVQRSNEFFEEIGDQQGRAINARILGDVAVETEDYETAITQYRNSVELFREVGIPQGRATSRRDLGDALAASGNTEKAREHWRTALETFDDVGAVPETLETLQYLAEACSEVGDEEASERWVDRARETLSKASEEVTADHRDWIRKLGTEK